MYCTLGPLINPWPCDGILQNHRVVPLCNGSLRQRDKAFLLKGSTHVGHRNIFPRFPCWILQWMLKVSNMDQILMEYVIFISHY